METEILLQAEAGAVSSHSSEAAMGPVRQEGILLAGFHCSIAGLSPSDSFLLLQTKVSPGHRAQPACLAAAPLGSASWATSNSLNTLWECLDQTVIPSKGQKSSPATPKIQRLPQEELNSLVKSLSFRCWSPNRKRDGNTLTVANIQLEYVCCGPSSLLNYLPRFGESHNI